jgi:hypothetical protein
VRPRLFALLLGAVSFAASPVQSPAPFDPAGKWLITTIDDLGTPVSIGLDISGKPGAYSGQAFNGDDVMPLVDLATTPTGMIALFGVRQGVVVVRMAPGVTGKMVGTWGAMPEAMIPLTAERSK